MRKENIVYVVHCVDTEGPLYESIEATFKRVNKIFNLNLKVSKENLKKLQNKEIDLNGKEDAVYNVVAPKRINTNDTWDKIDNMLDIITNEEFRQKYSDSFGNGWVYNWFCMDHVGFTGENPRRRDLGYHNIFDHYRLYNKLNDNDQDLLQWHYHPLPLIKDAHRSGTTYLNSSNIYEILARKIIDCQWFPAAFRPGFHTERPDSHWFLEQWIPFDYANQAVRSENNQPDLNKGRFGDWTRAPQSWIPYHPDYYDYQKRGNCNRFIARCLNIDSRIREITEREIIDAFEETKEHGSSLLSFTNHDWRDMCSKIDKVWRLINKVSRKFKNIKFKHVNAIKGMREVLNLKNLRTPGMNIIIDKKENSAKLTVKTKNKIFGVQPYLAIKTKEQNYYWQNFDFYSKDVWTYTFDFNTIGIDAIEKIGVAANTKQGVTEVKVINPESEKIKENILNK